jgi:hypothetical protein
MRLRYDEIMSNSYCYWSVATGAYAELMKQCVASARQAGVFKEFHILTDRQIEGCECYDAQTLEMTNGLFKLIYLKVGISKLLFDNFIWIDADSYFVRNPRSLMDCMGKSPIHVPLTTNLSMSVHDGLINGISTKQYVELMTGAGVYNPVFLSDSSFWIVRREAIDRVVELATQFLAYAKEKGFTVNVSAGLGYAMQMLCADPGRHRLSCRPDLWASDDQNHFQTNVPKKSSWTIKDNLTGETHAVNPAIVHLPHRLAKRT